MSTTPLEHKLANTIKGMLENMSPGTVTNKKYRDFQRQARIAMAEFSKADDHPALQVPCKHCGAVGMCPAPLACIHASNKDSTPPQVEYDRGLIADMLDALITFGDKLAGFTYRSINDQIALLRAADNRDAAGVHTAKATPGDAEAVGYVDAGDLQGMTLGNYGTVTVYPHLPRGIPLYTRPAPPVVDEVVAWAVDRDGDRTFPRIYATEAEADHMVFNVTVNPPATKRAVIGYEAVKAALTAALGKGNNNG